MKVYGVVLGGRFRAVVAARSKAAAAEAFGTTVRHVTVYGSVTGNREEVEVAMAEPGVAWTRPCNSTDRNEWKRRGR